MTDVTARVIEAFFESGFVGVVLIGVLIVSYKAVQFFIDKIEKLEERQRDYEQKQKEMYGELRTLTAQVTDAMRETTLALERSTDAINNNTLLISKFLQD